jgi:uncharacterized protein YneF (UPF0154 family)
MFAVDWSNLTVAAAFIVGAIGGAFAAIRITRYLLQYLREEHRDGDR